MRDALRRLAVLCMLALAHGAAFAGLPLQLIHLPPGFRIELLARLPNAREMTLGAGRILYVGSMAAGKVYAVELDDHWRARRTRVIASGLEMPVGVAWHEGALYVSAVSRILRFDGIDARIDDPPKPVVVTDGLPTETHHGWKFIAFGPDGRLYVPVGAPCNICEPDPRRYALIRRMKPDGTDNEVYATGIRNSVGFDWDPATHDLWFTDNGRDLLGDDMPPDELNHATGPGRNFGYPYCHGGDLPDPGLGARHPCSEFDPPAQKLGAHVAPLGMRFYTGSQFPADYRGQIFVAEHGSWNRSKKVGYRISLIRLRDGRAIAYETFAGGWLQGETPWGRPADVLVLPDGSLLVSDDLAGVVYRITYRGKE